MIDCDEILFEDNIALYYQENIIKLLKHTQKITTSHDTLSKLREIKSPTERKTIEQAITIIDSVFVDVYALKTSGKITTMTEQELQKYVCVQIYAY